MARLLSAIFLCAVALSNGLVPHISVALNRWVSKRAARCHTCAPMMKLNKQTELARLMEQAKRQQQGLDATPQPTAPTKPKKQLQTQKAPLTREDLFALMSKRKAQSPDESPGPASQMRYGKSAAARASPSNPSPVQAAYSYSDFDQLLQGSGRSSRTPRPMSEERLQRGTLFPTPSGGLKTLDGVPNAFASLEALTEGRRTLVLIASWDDYLAERLRQTLVAFSSSMPAGQLDVALAGVCAAPLSSLRKLTRKSGIRFPILSDTAKKWLPLLNCAPDGEVVVYLIDARTQTVVSCFAGVGAFVPSTLVATVTAAIKQRNKEPSTSMEPANNVPEGDDMPEEWAWAAGPGAEPAAPTPVAALSPMPARRATAAPPPAPTSPPSELTELEKENAKLRAQLRDVAEREALRRVEAENARLKAELQQVKASEEDYNNDIKVLEAERAARSAAAAKAAEAAQQAAQAQEAELAEKAEMLRQLKEAKELAAAEAKRRQEVQDVAAAELAASTADLAAANAAARKAAEAAWKAAESAAWFASQKSTAAKQDFVVGGGYGGRPYRPYGLWLPGLRKVAKLLNGTVGIKRVASSRVYRKPNATRDDSADSGWNENPAPASGSAQASMWDSVNSVNSVRDRLIIRIQGTGDFGAHRLVASFVNDRGLRTQQLFVTCEPDFSIAQLRDLLRALQPVLNFILDDGSGMDAIPF